MPQSQFIESIQNLEPVEIIEEIPEIESAEVGDEVLKQPRHYEFELLDKTKVRMRTDFTLHDLLKKRLDSKLMALESVIREETKRLGKEKAGSINALIASSDAVQEITLDIVAKLADIERSTFDDNISGLGITLLTIELMKILGAMAQKSAAQQTTGGKKRKKSPSSAKA